MRTRYLIQWCVFVLLFSSLAYGADRKFEKKYSVSPGGTLVVKTDIGSLNVVGSGGSEVSILVEMHGKDRDLERFEVTSDQNATGVEVRGRQHKSGWGWFGGNDLDARFTISVPKEYNLDVRTAGGDVEIRSIKGKVEGKTSGGDVRVKDTDGPLNVATSGGSIMAEDLKGDLRAQTSGGDVQVKNIAGGVDAGTSGGNVTVSDADGMVKAGTSGGNVTVKVRGSNRGVHAETSGGNVTIAIAKSVAATIDASTSGGDVECDLPVTVSGKIKSTSIQGTVNGGGNTIYAHTSGGNVRIRGLE